MTLVHLVLKFLPGTSVTAIFAHVMEFYCDSGRIYCDVRATMSRISSLEV